MDTLKATSPMSLPNIRRKAGLSAAEATATRTGCAHAVTTARKPFTYTFRPELRLAWIQAKNLRGWLRRQHCPGEAK